MKAKATDKVFVRDNYMSMSERQMAECLGIPKHRVRQIKHELRLYKWHAPSESNAAQGTLCWTCARACGGCSWSRKPDPSPVEGWEAVSHSILGHWGGDKHWMISYRVISCPGYTKGRAPLPELDEVFWQGYTEMVEMD